MTVKKKKKNRLKNKQGYPYKEPDVKGKEEVYGGLGTVKRGRSYPCVLIIDSDSLPLSVTPLLSNPSPRAHVELYTACTQLLSYAVPFP